MKILQKAVGVFQIPHVFYFIENEKFSYISMYVYLLVYNYFRIKFTLKFYFKIHIYFQGKIILKSISISFILNNLYFKMLFILNYFYIKISVSHRDLRGLTQLAFCNPAPSTCSSNWCFTLQPKETSFSSSIEPLRSFWACLTGYSPAVFPRPLSPVTVQVPSPHACLSLSQKASDLLLASLCSMQLPLLCTALALCVPTGRHRLRAVRPPAYVCA